MNDNSERSGGDDGGSGAGDPPSGQDQQQAQALQAAQMGQQPGGMGMLGYGNASAMSQEAVMNMLRQNQGGAGMMMFPPGQQQQQGGAGGVDASGQPMPAPGSDAAGQTPQMPNAAMMQTMGYPMFDPSQMQGMAAAGFGAAFPGMAGMDPSAAAAMNPMFMQMQQAAAAAAAGGGGDGQNAAMTQASAALGQAQLNTMNSAAAMQGMMNPAAAAAMQGMQGMNMMNPAAMAAMGGADPNMLLRLMSGQQGNFFGAPGAPNAQMFGLGAGLSGAAGITAASYLNMAQQAGIGGTGGGAADLQQSMMPGMMGAGGAAAVLNPFARAGKPAKQRKSKNKPKRPLSAYNIFFKDERARILSGIPDDGKKKKIKTEDGEDAGEEPKLKGEDDEGSTTVKKEDDADGEEPKDDSERGDEEDGGDKDKDGKGAAGKKRKRVPHGKIGFESLAKIIGRRWKELPPEELEGYKRRAEEDMKRYRKEMETYLQKQREGLEQSREHLENMVDDDTKKQYFGDGQQQQAEP